MLGSSYTGPAPTDPAGFDWPFALRPGAPDRERAVQSLHELLLRAARFEVGRRAPSLPFVGREHLDDMAYQAASDALVAILAKLDDFQGASRFTTWAYKFALLEAAVAVRRRAWQGHEVVLDADGWRSFADGKPSSEQQAESAEALSTLFDSIAEDLTAHQRQVVVSLAFDGVPIDVLAERLTTTRGALYKTLRDARKKLRQGLAERGVAI